MALTCESVTRF